jgi:carboxyl-terminal processing protease
LLTDGWVIMTQEAQTLGVRPPLQPSFVGDRTAAFEAFRAAYVPFASSVPDPTRLRYGVIRGMSDTLRDCHTFFLSPVLSDTLIETRSGKGSVGIGVELASVPPLVTEVITGGPAAVAGVAVGDRIATIDGADASNLGPAGAYDRINGDEGTTVRLGLRRAGQSSVVDVTLTRQRVNPPNVDFRVIGDSVGYVRVRNFVDGGIHQDLRNVLEDFERRGVTGWIIDLRGNPGGRLDTGAIDLFVRDGATVKARGRDGSIEETLSTGAALAMLRPTVLLTNNLTGSVAEVFAAALQEYGLAYVIGANTNGCVGYTDVQPFADGSSLAVTTHVNLGPVTGTVLNGIGVAPDLAVARTPDDIANARDPQLDAAVAHLTSTP